MWWRNSSLGGRVRKRPLKGKAWTGRGGEKKGFLGGGKHVRQEGFQGWWMQGRWVAPRPTRPKQ